MIIRIAWRNIWRNKVRSLVVITAIAIGLWGGIFSYAFMQGMGEQQIYSAIHTETGHIQMNQPDFLLNYDLKSTIDDYKEVEKALKAFAEVKGVTSRIQLTAMASSSNTSSGITVNGIDPDSFNTVSELDHNLVKGSFFEGKSTNQIVIGQQLAEKLHAKLNTQIVIALQNYSGEIVNLAFNVVGIYKLHNSEYNEQMIFVKRKDLQKAIGFPSGETSTINILLDKNENSTLLKNKIQQKFSDLQVQTWEEISPMLQIMSGTMNQMSMIFVFIILLALTFGIINTMLMAVMDRTREIGMLLCIGMNRKKIFMMIIFETLFLSLTGAIAGLLLSVGTIQYFGEKGVNLSVISEGINALGFSSYVYPVLKTEFYSQFALMVIIIAIFSSLFPARRAIKLNPAEAVRGE